MNDLVAIDYIVITIFSACILMLTYNVAKIIWYTIAKNK
jgi:hypothetical protein